MTQDQVKLIKEAVLKDDGTGNPLAYTLSVLFNNEVTFRNTDDFVIWDDANELVHAIKINMDGPRQSAIAPYRIATGCFGNIQFLEGLFTMSNFSKAVDELFVKTGLITEEKKEMIMEWANNIRNNMSMPSNPGPYYPTGPMIPPAVPKPDVRPGDGIWHGAPIDQRTKENKLRKLIDPIIEAAGYEKTKPGYYRYDYISPEEIGPVMKKAIEAVPEKDLFWAALGNGKMYAEYNPKVPSTKERFEEVAAQLLSTINGMTTHLDLNVEAYGVRVKYCFALTKVNDDAADQEWKDNAEVAIVTGVGDIMQTLPAVTSVSLSGNKISATIEDSDTDLGIPQIISSIEGLQKATYTLNNPVRVVIQQSKFIYTAGGSMESFMKGVKSTMPTENDQTINATLEVQSKNNVQLTYTLNVKYFNEADMPVMVNGKGYKDFPSAIKAAVEGDTIVLNKDIDGITAMIPVQKKVDIDLNGHTVTANSNHLFVFTGFEYDVWCTIKNGTLKNTMAGPNGVTTLLAQKASVRMEKVTVESETTFGVEAGVQAQGYWGCLDLVNCNIKAKNAIGIYGPETKGDVEFTENPTVVKIDGQCMLEGTDSFGVMCNGAAHNTQVEIADGASITTNGLGIYHPQIGTMTIGAAEIEAGLTGMEVRAGNVVATGTEFRTTCLDFKVKPDNSGSTTSGAGVAVAQHVTKLPVNVTLNNVTAHGIYGFYESNPQKNDAEALTKVNVSIENGTYEGSIEAIYSEDLTGFVGPNTKMSTEPKVAYVKDGYVADEVDGSWTIIEVPPIDAVATEATIDSIVEGLTGIVVVPTEENNVYNLTTENGKISDSGIFKKIAEIGNVVIEVTDGTNTVTYDTTGAEELSVFEAAVDAMVPKDNDAAEVTLTMTVTVS